MTKGLSEKEKEAIRALAKASSEALVATVMRMRQLEQKRAEARASAGSSKTRS